MSERTFEDHGGGLLARLIWSDEQPLPEHLAEHCIQAVVAQRPDGSIVLDDPSLAPRIYILDGAHTTEDARALAAALVSAADLADRWTGVNPDHGRLMAYVTGQSVGLDLGDGRPFTLTPADALALADHLVALAAEVTR